MVQFTATPQWRNLLNDRGQLKVKSGLLRRLKCQHQWEWNHGPFRILEKTVRQAAQAVIDSALLKLKTIDDKTFEISSRIVPGPPSQAIVDEAESWGADLIVMGSRGKGTWNRLLLGSVSSAVVHHAKCSVEIVRKPQSEERGKAPRVERRV